MVQTRQLGMTPELATQPSSLGKGQTVKTSTIVTSVASLLTFATVAVLPAFALDTGGVQRRYDVQGSREKSYSSTKSSTFKKSEDFSRARGERERYAKGDRREHDGYRWGHDKNERRDDHDGYRWGHGKQDGRGGRQYGHGSERDRGQQGGRSYASRS
jgi:hypothetical protein